jgi:zeaxanthin glucosyltransferase
MKIAAIANAGASHQMTMCAIGRELQKQGHSFTILGTRFQSNQLKLPNIEFECLGAGRTDPVERYYQRAMRETELSLSSTLEYMKSMAELLCDEAAVVLKGRRIEFVLADQEEPGAATAAELAGLPYASICSSLPLNEASDIPPGFVTWPYSRSLIARARNRLAYRVRNFAIDGIHRVVNHYRGCAGLPPYRKPDDSFSTLAQIAQLVPSFDFPRTTVPPVLHFVGPFQRQALSAVPFPFDRLDGRPLIYASFGTTFGGRTAELRPIAEACATLPVQLVISLGGAEPQAEHSAFPGNPLIVRYAPQRKLLSAAALAITHAGLNTTLEALSFGVPLLALPIAGDQLGVSARIQYHGVGLVLNRKQRTAGSLKSAISSILNDSRWRIAAKRMQAAVGNSAGAAEAARIIEKVAESHGTPHLAR